MRGLFSCTQGKRRSVFLAQGDGWRSFWLTVSDAGLCIVLGFTVLASLATQTVKNLPAVWETGFDPWVGKIPWRREWLPTPVFLLGEFHGQKLQFKGSQRVRHDE